MDTSDTSPGPLRDEKTESASPPDAPEPEAAEVESARLLVNDTRIRLQGRGLDEQEILRLADRFIAEDRGQDPDVFVDWALAHREPA